TGHGSGANRGGWGVWVCVGPELLACVRCGFRRTLRVGARRVCFQCRSNWVVAQPSEAAERPGPPPLQMEVAWPFTAAEVLRLRIYRAAVRAGFYSDATGVVLWRMGG
ncbi:MAG TPA: hypothetical protein VGQ62_03640, partial [Chloroflexota bacterium]|nr:hypothetical protein [Chloroflexota bacterium]